LSVIVFIVLTTGAKCPEEIVDNIRWPRTAVDTLVVKNCPDNDGSAIDNMTGKQSLCSQTIVCESSTSTTSVHSKRFSKAITIFKAQIMRQSARLLIRFNDVLVANFNSSMYSQLRKLSVFTQRLRYVDTDRIMCAVFLCFERCCY